MSKSKRKPFRSLDSRRLDWLEKSVDRKGKLNSVTVYTYYGRKVETQTLRRAVDVAMRLEKNFDPIFRHVHPEWVHDNIK